jgi:hypothetical protein
MAVSFNSTGFRVKILGVIGALFALALIFSQQNVAVADGCQTGTPVTSGNSVTISFTCGNGGTYYGNQPTTYAGGNCSQSAPQTNGNSVTVSFSCGNGYVNGNNGYWGGNNCNWGGNNCGNNCNWGGNNCDSYYWNNNGGNGYCNAAIINCSNYPNYNWGNGNCGWGVANCGNYWNNNNWNNNWNNNVCYNWNSYC